jgi:hypothetical protein
MEYSRYSPTIFDLGTSEGCGQLHAQTPLSFGKGATVPVR